MEILNILRIMCMIAWGLVLLRLSPSVYRTIKGTPRFYDPLWCLLWAIGFTSIVAGARWLFIPTDRAIWIGLYGLVFATAITCQFMVRGYERS